MRITPICIIIMLLSTSIIGMSANSNEINLSNNKDDSSWPMFRNTPDNSGYSTSIAPNTDRLIWSYDIDYNTYSPNPIISDNKVYVGTNDGLYCLNSLNGSFKWKFPAPGVIHGSSAVYEDKVLLTSANKLFCLNSETGEKLWNKTAQTLSSPIIHDGNVYVVCNSGGSKLKCLSIEDGEQQWVHEVSEYSLMNEPAYSDGYICFVMVDYYYSNSVLRCIHADDGTFNWDYPLGYSFFGEVPSISDGKVFATSIIGDLLDQGILYCIDLSTGSKNWDFQSSVDEWPESFEPPAIYSNSVVFSTYHQFDSYGKIYCISISSGTKIWNKKINDLRTGPIIADNKIFYAGGGYGENGTINCLNFNSGSFKWSFELNHSVTGNVPSVADGKLFMVDDKGTVYAFEDVPNEPPNTPSISGEINGKVGESYEYIFVSTDIEDYDLFYYIDWGDGETEEWIGPYASGEELELTYSWEEQDTYTIRCKVKDIYDAESDWATLEVTMPQHKPILDLLQSRFPGLFKLLNVLFERYI